MYSTLVSVRGGVRLGSLGQIDALLACVCFLATPMALQAQAPPASDTIRLANGTVLVGHVTSFNKGQLHIRVDALGDLTVDSSAMRAAAPRQMGAPAAAIRHSPWSGTLSASGAYVSQVVPELVGSSLGVQLSATVARATPAGGFTLDGTLGYWRVEPEAAAMDQWAVTLGWHHELAPRFPVLARSTFDVNRVQTLKYRSTTLVGVGYAFVKRPSVSLAAAPGIGYARSEQTQRGRVLAFAAGKSPEVDGFTWGAHEMLMAQLTPTLGVQQNILWLHGWTETSYRQLQADAKLTAMVMKHLALLIVFTQQYDNSMPAPVNKTIRTLNPGVQFVF